MTPKTQKIISTIQIAIVSLGGFEVLAYILNLNQPVIYLKVAFWIFLYFIFNVIFLFDLHFKKRGSWQRAREKHDALAATAGRDIKIVLSSFWDRIEHLRRWQYMRQMVHFLLLPSFIFWSTVTLFYVNFGFLKAQQVVAILSSVALTVDYWYIKEVFYRRKEVVDSDIFVVLTVIKIYTALILYGASMAMLRYYCLPALYFSAEVFSYTFLLIYHALYQHRKVYAATTAVTFIIALMMAVIGQYVYIHWGYNYFTAAVFMAACYNLFWGIFHFRLDRALTRQAFIEIFIVTVLVAGMMFSVTNFKAKILDGCNYATGQM